MLDRTSGGGGGSSRRICHTGVAISTFALEGHLLTNRYVMGGMSIHPRFGYSVLPVYLYTTTLGK